MKVIKRDGTTVDFDSSKIVVAIQKANAVVDPQDRIEEYKILEIAKNVQSRNRMRLLVEDIQDIVEHSLMDAGKLLFGKISSKEIKGKWVKIDIKLYLHE